MFKNILSYFYLLIYFSVQIVLTKTQDCIDARSRPGKCIALAKCPDIMEEFYDQTRTTSDVMDFQSFISNYVCGSDGADYMICCRSRSMDKVVMPDSQMHSQHLSKIASSPGRETTIIFAPLDPPTSVNNPKPISRPVNKNKPNIKQPPKKPVQQISSPPQQISTGTATGSCGTNQIFIHRIVGGREARRGNYPWIAALGYSDYINPSFLQYQCGGSLISSKHVITAAHCIKSQLSVVRLGAYDLSNHAEPNARNYRIKRAIVHEQYDRMTTRNDIAIIELNKRVVMTRYINTICLPENPRYLESLSMKPFVAGWGAQWNKGPMTDILKDAQVPVVNINTCAESYTPILGYWMHGKKVICAGNGFDNTCYGDSGGPLMVPEVMGSKRRYHLVGIVSFGFECADGIPGVYTKVSVFMPWIKNIIS